MENLYDILGIAPNASTDEIKKRYRAMAMRYHPDRNTESGAEARFNAIQKAYEVLSDAKLRDEYNQKFNERIVLDPEDEACKLWQSLFNANGVVIAS
ncbi:MAG: DnaJ domain-containing protein [Gallionella sp.]